jgi:hypothetical protein
VRWPWHASRSTRRTPAFVRRKSAACRSPASPQPSWQRDQHGCNQRESSVANVTTAWHESYSRMPPAARKGRGARQKCLKRALENRQSPPKCVQTRNPETRAQSPKHSSCGCPTAHQPTAAPPCKRKQDAKKKGAISPPCRGLYNTKRMHQENAQFARRHLGGRTWYSSASLHLRNQTSST